MNNVLFTASIERHLSGFHAPYLRYFKQKGYAVSTAASGENAVPCVDRHYDIPFDRSPLSLRNIRCYRILKRVIDENHFDIIHCHTPVVSVLTRLAARKARKNGTVVIYTAHGFHFYDGAPRKSVIFRWMEKWMSRYTDCLITINAEDHRAVAKYGFRPVRCVKAHGVGVDAARFERQTMSKKQAAREKYGISGSAFVFIFAAGYTTEKNQRMLIDAAAILKRRIPDILLLLPGDGPARADYERMIKEMGLEENVWLMGARSDVDALLQAADCAVSSSVREGLPINIVEALAVSLPVVATRIRGHVDLIEDGENGFLVRVNDVGAMADRLLYLYEHPAEAAEIGRRAGQSVKPFLLESVIEEMKGIYETVLKAEGVRTDEAGFLTG